MKILLYILGAIAFVGPLLFWGFISEMACGYNLSNSSCGASLGDFFDWEFLNIAALPWAIAAICFITGYRRGRKA